MVVEVALVFQLGGGCSSTIVVPGWAAVAVVAVAAAPRLVKRFLEERGD